MTEVYKLQPSQHTSLQSMQGDPTVDELYHLALTRGVNLGQLIAQTNLIIEEAADKKAHLKIDELQAHEKKFRSVTEFLSLIEAQLSNSNAHTVNLADKSSLVEDMHSLCEHPLLTKSSWTREEADTIRTALTRQSQITMQQVHHASSAVNRAIEERTELLQISRKVLELLQQLIQTFTRNQRV